VLLCLPVTGTETVNVSCIEGMKLQRGPRQADEYKYGNAIKEGARTPCALATEGGPAAWH
jgi:hypothetical protein